MQLKWYFLFCAICITRLLNAQVISGFEQWDTLSYGIVPKPFWGNVWMSSDSILKKYNSIATTPGVIIASANNYGVHSGNSALCITSSFYTDIITHISDSAGAQICLGYLDPHTLLPEGIAYTDRPIALEGYYKIVGNATELDSAHIYVELLQGSALVGKINQIFTTPSAQYNYFNIPITYVSNAPINTLKLMFSMGAIDYVTQDTSAKFLLDDIAFVLPTTLKTINNFSKINLAPNPCANVLSINVDTELQSIFIANTLGEIIESKKNIQMPLQINTSAWPIGMYYLNAVAEFGRHYATSFYRQ